jgi:hypothetical protein
MGDGLKHTDESAVRVTLYHGSDARLDVKLHPSSWFAQVRLWRGRRWPSLERTWYARLRPWIPWFSLERQALRAATYLSDREPPPGLRRAIQQEVRIVIERMRVERG